MSTHTPGPWVTQKELREAYKRGMLRVYQSPPLPSPDEANARLIAAAPAMLEALRQIVWKLSHNFDTGPATISRLDATVRMAEDAIALAEGGK